MTTATSALSRMGSSVADPREIETAVPRIPSIRLLNVDTLLLHTAEQWRDRLLAGDDAVTAWMAEFPGTEPQPFRALVRQARKDAPAPGAAAESRGEAPRKGRAYRELFQWLRAELARAQEAAEDAAAAAPQAPSPGEDF